MIYIINREIDFPNNLIDPISYDFLYEPIISSNRVTYNKNTIEKLNLYMGQPDYKIGNLIRKFLYEHNIDLDHTINELSNGKTVTLTIKNVTIMDKIRNGYKLTKVEMDYSLIKKINATCHILVIDCSMEMKDKIQIINDKIREYIKNIPNGDELAIVSFSENGKILQNHIRLNKNNRNIDFIIQISGESNIRDGIKVANDVARSRLSKYVTCKIFSRGKNIDVYNYGFYNIQNFDHDMCDNIIFYLFENNDMIIDYCIETNSKIVILDNNGGCFTGDSLIETTEGLIRIDSITKNTIVITNKGPSKVIQMTILDYYDDVYTVEECKLTPYHPILVNESPIFPIEIGKHSYYNGHVYDLILENRGIIKIGTRVYAASLNHNIKIGCFSHTYFGTENIQHDLFHGMKRFKVYLNKSDFHRDICGKVIGLDSKSISNNPLNLSKLTVPSKYNTTYYNIKCCFNNYLRSADDCLRELIAPNTENFSPYKYDIETGF